MKKRFPLLLSVSCVVFEVYAKAMQPTTDPLREGLVLLKNKHYIEAILALRRAYEDHPYSPEALQAYSKALFYTGRRIEAIRLLQKYERTGTVRVPLEELADVYSRTFLTADNFNKYQEALAWIHNAKITEAKKRLLELSELEPGNAEIGLKLAQTQTLDGDFDSAYENLRNVRSLSPRMGEVSTWLGWTLLQRGEKERALPELEAGYFSAPKSELAAVWLAEAYLEVGQTPRAVQILEKSISDNLTNRWALYRWAALLGPKPHVIAKILSSQKISQDPNRTRPGFVDIPPISYRPKDLDKKLDAFLAQKTTS